jgi:chemotaxis protein histidine kinase CheA
MSMQTQKEMQKQGEKNIKDDKIAKDVDVDVDKAEKKASNDEKDEKKADAKAEKKAAAKAKKEAAAKAKKEAAKAKKEAAKAKKEADDKAKKDKKAKKEADDKAKKEAAKAKTDKKEADEDVKKFSNKDKVVKNKDKVVNVFNPDAEGFSDWVDVLDIKKGGLPVSRNGNGRKGVYFGVGIYLWEVQRLRNARTGKLQKLRLIGNNEPPSSRKISKPVYNHYKGVPCVNCGSIKDLVVDHKNDFYNDNRVLKIETQTIDDFQSLCTSCNLKKRTWCSKMRETGIRTSAIDICPLLAEYGVDYISGDETYDLNDPDALVGTYWFDCVEFRRVLIEGYITPAHKKLQKDNEQLQKDNEQLQKDNEQLQKNND